MEGVDVDGGTLPELERDFYAPDEEVVELDQNPRRSSLRRHLRLLRLEEHFFDAEDPLNPPRIEERSFDAEDEVGEEEEPILRPPRLILPRDVAWRTPPRGARRRSAAAPAQDDAIVQALAYAARVVGQFLSELRHPQPQNNSRGTAQERAQVLARIARRYDGPASGILWAEAQTWCETVFEVCCDVLSPLEMEAFLVLLRRDSPGDLVSRRGPSRGRTLLHLAAGRRAPIEVVKLLVRWNRDALEVHDDDGHLPLHRACGYFDNRPLDLSLLKFLVHEHPPALRVRCRSGRLPLHHATHRMFRPLPNVLESIRMLIDAYPDALVAVDLVGMTPIMVGFLGSPAFGKPEPSPQALELLRSIVQGAGAGSVRTFENGRRSGANKFAIDCTALDTAYRYCPKPCVIEIVIDAWPAVLILKEVGKWAVECPACLKKFVESESHATFLALVEVLLHETTEEAIPVYVRRGVLRALGKSVPIRELNDENRSSNSLAAIRAIQRHVRGRDRERELRCNVLMENRDLQEFLKGADAIQKLVAGFYRKNKAGRFLALVEVLLHERTSETVPNYIRRSVLRALERFVPAGELNGSSSLEAVRAIQRHVREQERERELRSKVLDNPELQEFLKGAWAIQELAAGFYIMNKAGRLDVVEGSSSYHHALVLESAGDNLSCLFLHMRECCNDILAGMLMCP